VIKCVRFRHYEKHGVKGLADIELSRIGIVIRECLWIEDDGKELVQLPMRGYRNKDGSQQFRPLIEFAEGTTGERASKQFQEQALAAIRDFVATSRRVP
jgi:hypothetical protein